MSVLHSAIHYLNYKFSSGWEGSIKIAKQMCWFSRSLTLFTPMCSFACHLIHLQNEMKVWTWTVQRQYWLIDWFSDSMQKLWTKHQISEAFRWKCKWTRIQLNLEKGSCLFGTKRCLRTKSPPFENSPVPGWHFFVFNIQITHWRCSEKISTGCIDFLFTSISINWFLYYVHV